MSGAKKITTVFDDQLNAKIQRKFDLVFNDKLHGSSNEDFSDEIEFGTGQDEEFVMENNGKKNEGNTSKISEINLDFTLDDVTTDLPETSAQAKPTAEAVKADDDGLGFSLNFDLDAEIESKPEVTADVSFAGNDDSGFTLDDSDIGIEMEFDEATKKTVMVSTEALTNSNLAEFSLGTGGSADHMSKEESKANIETTIKEIIRPKLSDTKEIDISSLDKTAATQSGIADIEDSILDFREKTDSKVFDLDSIDKDAFTVEITNPKNTQMSDESTGEFDIAALESDFLVSEEVAPVVVAPVAQKIIEKAPVVSTPSFEATPGMGLGGSNITTEDSMRFQATIRALREEREEMLAQIKSLKSESKELEQDNLTIKANLDEAKIEITILRKRHMVELEDIKYRLAMSEEKKAMADEKARQADMRREKLEQKVRIDFNQVKQREKELESKLELLSMDVDSQVQSRDQKILELRRKIDALEFNMENASIKEQKSLDDKRKLEDRLNKIMKTLRHSIKNLEDDIDQAHEDDDHQKEKN